MIIYGSRMYFRKNKLYSWGECSNCGKYGRLSSYNARKFGHLYFIPLIPEGPPTRVVKECGKCSHGFHFPEADLPPLLTGIFAKIDSSLNAVAEGHETFVPAGETAAVNCLSYTVGNLELLYCLGQEDYLRQTIGKWGQHRNGFGSSFAGAVLAEVQGDDAMAESLYRKAAELYPEHAATYARMGTLYRRKKDLAQAEMLFRNAENLDPEDIEYKQLLLNVYTDLKDHDKLAETYERCFALVPALAGDKTAMKSYQKACKKSGRVPKVG